MTGPDDDDQLLFAGAFMLAVGVALIAGAAFGLLVAFGAGAVALGVMLTAASLLLGAEAERDEHRRSARGENDIAGGER